METSVPARRGRRFLIPYLLLGVLALGSVAAAWTSSRTTNTTIGPEGVAMYDVPNLAPASTTRAGEIVDGITCQSGVKEVVNYHVHVHVALYVNGRMVRLPAGIGFTQPPLIEKYAIGEFYNVGLYDCLYWLHTHVADGIIHVEAPAKESFTLGQFFDIWNQPLSDSQVGPAKGSVVVFENGKELIENPRQTPLLPHGDIQIDVGTPIVPFHAFTYKVSGSCGEGTNSCSSPES